MVTAKEAIIGGVRGNWDVPMEGEVSEGVWKDATFTLGDFTCLAAYLAKNITRETENPLISKLAELAVAPAPAVKKAPNG